ncbi:hypothetical protein [Shewanella baltica]|uniref:hypothetical protein n=1 Tax=Shewanella baltica TaxID=62322 RepID=UPI0039AEC588
MHKRLIGIAVVFGLLSTNTFAATDKAYQHDANINYGASSEAFSDGGWSADYRYYSTPVSQDSAPYALSGFLAQTSNFGGKYSFNDDIDSYGVNGEYVFASKWFVGANYFNLDSDFYDANTYGINLGYYFNATSAVYASYSSSDGDYDAGLSAKGNSDTDAFGIGIRSFIPLQSTAGIDLQANVYYSQSDNTLANGPNGQYNNSNNSTIVNLAADWYITRAWSIGANYSIQDDEDPYGINTAYHWRITDLISARAGIAKSLEPDWDGVDISLSLNGRF